MYRRAKELSEKSYDFCKLFYMLGGLADEGDGVPVKLTYHGYPVLSAPAAEQNMMSGLES